MMHKPWESGQLAISANKRYFVNGSKPFFWLGDTAWDLMQRLDAAPTDIYLCNRAEKGFNVIQAVLANFKDPGGKTSNQRVEACDVLQIIAPENAVYWQHVDSVVKKAEGLGIYMAMLPVWGQLVRDGSLNERSMPAYADFLTARYGGALNVIWVLGGDIRGDASFALWDAFGRKLKAGSPHILVGYHPFGRTSSSYWFNGCDWLDFNMFQSGHRRYDQRLLNSWDEAVSSEPWYGEDNWRYVRHDRSLTPTRPVLDGEPSYEQIPQGLHDPAQPYWQAHHVRRYAWWSVLSGSCGHTYGNNSIFQFWGTGYAGEFGVVDPWARAIHHTGGSQMFFVRRIAEEFGYQDCMPLEHTVTDQGEKEDYIPVLGTEDRLLAYDYTGRPFGLRHGTGPMRLYWIDPANGVRSYLGTADLSRETRLVPPGKKEGQNDWLLLALR